MCRLLAYVGEPVSAEELVFSGRHSFYEQSWAPKELLSGSVNADGFGVVWYANGRPARIAEARPIWYDPDLRGTLAAFTSGCVVAALRNATPGLPIDRAGLMPYVHDRWCFVLNGFVPRFRTHHMRHLRAQLPDDLYAELGGASDAETLFLLTLAEVRRGAALSDALCAVARTVHARVAEEEAQLNMVLSDGERVAAVRTGTRLVTNSLYLARRPPLAPDGFVLASEPPDPGAVWEPVDGHSWIEIEGDGTVRTDLLFL